jgi:hypothetical protein
MLPLHLIFPLHPLSPSEKINMVTILSLLVLAVACAATFLPDPDLPVVDLGYELHQAISFNVRANIPTPFLHETNRVLNIEYLWSLQLQQHQIRSSACRRSTMEGTNPSHKESRKSAEWICGPGLPRRTALMGSAQCLMAR